MDLTEETRNSENPSFPVTDVDAMELLLGGKQTASGVKINEQTADNYSPWWRGTSLIATGVAKTPLPVYRRLPEDRGKDKDRAHPAFRLLNKRPNTRVTSFSFKQAMVAWAISYGNGCAWIVRDGNARPTELLLLDPNPSVTRPEVSGGELYIKTEVKLSDSVTVPLSLPYINVLHFKGIGDGVWGKSVYSAAREALGLGLARQEYGARFFGNDASPGIIIETEPPFSITQIDKLKESLRRTQQGLSNKHGIAAMPPGARVKQLGLSAEDAQLVESGKLSIVDIANYLGVPVHKLGGEMNTSYNSLEQENQSFLDETLDGWMVAIEQECETKLLSEREKQADSHLIEFVRQSFVRADIGTRYNVYSIALSNRIMTPNEVRALENMNPYEGGDEFLVTNNTQGMAEGDPEDTEPAPEDDPEDGEGEDDERSGSYPAPDYPLFAAAGLSESLKNLSKYARQAAKNPRQFTEWLDNKLVDWNHSDVLDELHAHGVDITSLRERLADTMLAEMRTQLNRIAEKETYDTLYEAVDKFLRTYQQLGPADVVQEVMGDAD